MRTGWLTVVALSAAVPVAAQSPILVDRTAELKLEIHNAAACWTDLNNDGWVDLCAGGVWINEAGRQFRKLADGFGCAVAADFDNDGFADLFSWSSLQLFHNNAGEGFTLVALPELPPCVSRGACWGDLNGDGFVDLYVGGFEDWNAGITYPDLVLLNQQGQSFKLDWTEGRFRARGVTACDFDRDGDLDVYVSNYRLQPNLLWLNEGSGKMQNAADACGVAAASAGFAGGHSIGAAWGDFDNDGAIDLFAGNFAHVDNRGDQPKSRFLRNRAGEQAAGFKDLGTCGIFYQESYASPSVGDYDNDGDLDLYFTTVYPIASFHKPNFPVLFRNQGGFVFEDATNEAGLSRQPPTYQAAWADVDCDGDLDLATAGRLFVNQTTGCHWLEVRLQGDGATVNRSAVGAQVRIRLGDQVLTRQVEAGTGEGNQNDLLLHFGLGSHAEPVNLEIFWPQGSLQTVADVAIDRQVTCTYEPTRIP